MTVTPFTVDIPHEAVADLNQRLKRSRLPQAAPNRDFHQGTSGEYLRDLLADWRRHDWPARQAAINRLPQFRTEIEGVPLHFIQQAPEGPACGALLLLHGWPDTFLRYRRVVDRLVGEGYAVVVPSLPGYGFSGGDAQPPARTADLFAGLMSRLGHERFVAVGGDLGTPIVLQLGRNHGSRVIGQHLLDAGYPLGHEEGLSGPEKQWVDSMDGWFWAEGAYAHLHSTKPQTLAPALTDSPAGLAAWICSFVASGAVDHDVDAAFGGRDDLLDDLSIYWFTATGGSAADAYAGALHRTRRGRPFSAPGGARSVRRRPGGLRRVSRMTRAVGRRAGVSG